MSPFQVQASDDCEVRLQHPICAPLHHSAETGVLKPAGQKLTGRLFEDWPRAAGRGAVRESAQRGQGAGRAGRRMAIGAWHGGVEGLAPSSARRVIDHAEIEPDAAQHAHRAAVCFRPHSSKCAPGRLSSELGNAETCWPKNMHNRRRPRRCESSLNPNSEVESRDAKDRGRNKG